MSANQPTTPQHRQLLAHLCGDYLLQSDWQAQEKTQRWLPAVAHGITYTLPFVALTRSPARLAAIAASHTVIDRYRLARHVCWAKNQAAPARHRYPWSEGSRTGYRDDRPDWLSVWLMIIADNSIHLLANALALTERKTDEPS
jgi:hypothetical protein